MKVAIIGPFEIENYGDHIFKQVLEWDILRTYKNATIDLFAVFKGPLGFDATKHVHSIEDLEKHHRNKEYDVIILAGGSVVHFETLEQKVFERDQTYPIWKLWTISSYVASKYGTKLIWNSPEAPLNFTGWERPVVRNLVQAVDYKSVRNIASKKSLEECSIEDIILTPDTAFLLKELFPDDTLDNSFPKELKGINGSYAVFHCNHRLSDEHIPELIELFRTLKSKGICTVLLPLAYTNSEEVLLQKINHLANNELILIERKLAIPEIVSIFSRCGLYIGLSFHGAITTYCFGGEIIAFDYENRRKTKELYESVGKLKNYTTDIDTLKVLVNRYKPTNVKTNQDNSRVLSDIQHKLRQHFDHIHKVIDSKKMKQKNDFSEDVYIARTETKRRHDAFLATQEISLSYQQYKLATESQVATKKGYLEESTRFGKNFRRAKRTLLRLFSNLDS